MKILSTKTVFTSKKFHIVQKKIERNGKTFTKDIIERKSIILVIPYTENEIYLQSQFRDALEKKVLEIVQGTVEADEDPLEAAKRELQEEAGLIAKQWMKLAEWDLSAIMKMKMYVYAATELTEGEQHLDFDEEIAIMKIPFEKILERIDKGELAASHIAALLYFDRLRKEEKL